MASANQGTGHDPFPHGVPEENVVDLSNRRPTDESQPATNDGQPSTVNQPTTNDQRGRSTKAPIEAIKRFTSAVVESRTSSVAGRPAVWSGVKDRLEHWWWQLDSRSVSVFGSLVVVVVGGLIATQAWGALNHTRGAVLGASTEAYEHLRSAQKAVDRLALDQAAGQFAEAGAAFRQAEDQLRRVPGWVLAIVKLIPGPGGTVKSGEHLVSAGQHIAQAGEAMTKVMEQFQRQPTDAADDARTIAVAPLLEALSGDLEGALDAARLASDELARVDVASVPEAYRDQLAQVKRTLPTARQELGSVASVVTLLRSVLAADTTKEYLLIFQNTNEARATGGFIGSLAQVAVKDGTLRIVEVPGRGAYEINDDFDVTVIPPRPLWLINNRWQIQDANWWPDWPTSAAKIEWFYERARGFPISGVVSLTPTVIIDLLQLTGPVDLHEAYGVTVDAENFISIIQDIDYSHQENQPKAIIADLMPVVLNRLLTIKANQLLDSLASISRSVASKQMLFYFADPELQRLVQSLGWAGEVRPTPFDYLSVIHTNIGGGKTDLVIDTEIEHQAEIQADGSIINTVTIVRRHQGNPADEQEKIKNIDYVRILVPRGSRLLEAIGFETINHDLIMSPPAEAMTDPDLERLEGQVVVHEQSNTRIYDQFDKTVFANWLGVEVGKTVLATVSYRLPTILKPERPYSLLVQKQSGTAGDAVTSTLRWPEERYSLVTFAPENGVSKQANGLLYQSVLNVDRAWGALLKAKD